MGVREAAIEKLLRDKIKQAGGLAWKFTSPGTAGVPDRIVLLPGGRVVFVELIAPGQKPDPLQEHRLGQLRALGFEAVVLDSRGAVERFVDYLLS